MMVLHDPVVADFNLPLDPAFSDLFKIVPSLQDEVAQLPGPEPDVDDEKKFIAHGRFTSLRELVGNLQYVGNISRDVQGRIYLLQGERDLGVDGILGLDVAVLSPGQGLS